MKRHNSETVENWQDLKVCGYGTLVQILCSWTLSIILSLCKNIGLFIFQNSNVSETGFRLYLKTETESSLRNVVFWKINRTVFLQKDRAMDNVQKQNSGSELAVCLHFQLQISNALNFSYRSLNQPVKQLKCYLRVANIFRVLSILHDIRRIYYNVYS
jgi:hypothetical protein